MKDGKSPLDALIRRVLYLSYTATQRMPTPGSTELVFDLLGIYSQKRTALGQAIDTACSMLFAVFLIMGHMNPCKRALAAAGPHGYKDQPDTFKAFASI